MNASSKKKPGFSKKSGFFDACRARAAVAAKNVRGFSFSLPAGDGQVIDFEWGKAK